MNRIELRNRMVKTASKNDCYLPDKLAADLSKMIADERSYEDIARRIVEAAQIDTKIDAEDVAGLAEVMIMVWNGEIEELVNKLIEEVA